VNNTCTTNGRDGDGAGIRTTNDRNRVENNHCTENDIGLDLDGSENVVFGNTLVGNTKPVDAGADDHLDILISELPYTISFSGMYRLSGDIKLSALGVHGITIESDDITLDLNGHTLTGPGKDVGYQGNGIVVTDQHYNITIRNGNLRDWPECGVDAAQGENCHISDLRCYNNREFGIIGGSVSIVKDNICQSNEDGGISVGQGLVSRNNCLGNGEGIVVNNKGIVRNNASSNNTGNGIKVAGRGNIVAGNTCVDNGTGPSGAGVRIDGANNRIEANNVIYNVYGIQVFGTRNIIIRNTAEGNTTDYDIADNNSFGTIRNVGGGDSFTNSDPWSNFSF
jgi:parallel beta-helix repeat protein